MKSKMKADESEGEVHGRDETPIDRECVGYDGAERKNRARRIQADTETRIQKAEKERVSRQQQRSNGLDLSSAGYIYARRLLHRRWMHRSISMRMG